MRGKAEVPGVEKLNATEVVQMAFSTAADSQWNVTSRLYLRVAGATYEDAGNYTCRVHNGVGRNETLSETIAVLCEWKI